MGRRAGTFKTNLPSTATASGCVRFLHGIRVASTSRRSAMMQLALMCGGLALATWGCGFLDMVFGTGLIRGMTYLTHNACVCSISA